MFIIAIIVVMSQIFFGKNSLRQQRIMAKTIATYQSTIDSLNNVIEERDIEIERLKKDSLYKVEILRTHYGMSIKGEKVFQLSK